MDFDYLLLLYINPYLKKYLKKYLKRSSFDISNLQLDLVVLLANQIHIKRVEQKYGKAPELLKSYHTKELELSTPYDKAFDLCISAVKSLKKVEIKELNKHLGKIVALKPTKIPLDWVYNRDIISIELHRADDSKTKVKITSKPSPDPPSEYYIDYGSNLENVEKILEHLIRNTRSS